MPFQSIIAIIILLMMAVPTRAGERLRIATEGAYPPFSFIHENGQLTGFDVDIAKALCDALKAECEISAVPWERLLTDLAAGRYDMIVASMAETPERAQLAEFTDAYYRIPNAFIGRSAGGIIEVTPTTARGKVLAAQRSTIQGAYLQQNYHAVTEVKLFDTLPAAFEALVQGKVDFVLANALLSYSFIYSETGQKLEIIGNVIPEQELSSLSFIQVRKGNLKLRDAVNQSLREIKSNGVYH